MNWANAVHAMKRGAHVIRSSEQTRKLIGHSGGVPVYECGAEAMRLVSAWTADDAPVMVFQGVGSKVMFVPDEEHMSATDWVVEE